MSGQEDGARPAVTLVGDQWSPECSVVRTFLTRSEVAYTWLRPGDPRGGRMLADHGLTAADAPVLFDEAGRMLRARGLEPVAEWLGLHTDPGGGAYDLVVVGGGPAGMAAAVYGASEGLRTVLVERWAIGGQSGLTSRIENYLGFPEGISGADLADRARRQAEKFGAELVLTRHASTLAETETETQTQTGDGFTLGFADGGSVTARAVILATGANTRTLHAPGVSDFVGRGVYYYSALTEAPLCTGAEVYIVGGANSAGQAAIYFSECAHKVVLLVRGESLEQEMSTYLIKQIAAIASIEVRTHTEVAAAAGDSHLEQLTLRDTRTDTTETVEATWLFAFIGAAPDTAWLGPRFLRDDAGGLVTGNDIAALAAPEPAWPLTRAPYHLETTVPGVFAAGDVRSWSGRRVAAAVGEGSMAVMLVHKYLEA
ncbi:thioredoxin reductase (NADPH) [Catenulispora sp. GAS73]|uniref:NAD(P)/FAD-dependent oxidoreductase n=1 Tax=Catenulispora sp. GAS73 TaxID=3156269 RepID=UPI0035151D22